MSTAQVVPTRHQPSGRTFPNSEGGNWNVMLCGYVLTDADLAAKSTRHVKDCYTCRAEALTRAEAIWTSRPYVKHGRRKKER